MDEKLISEDPLIRIEVRPFVAKDTRKPTKRVYVRFAGNFLSLEQLVGYFMKQGKVMECNVVHKSPLGETLAYLEFQNATAHKILSKMSYVNIEGVMVSISEHLEQTNKAAINFRDFFYSDFKCNVYINNLHARVTEAHLHKCFSQFGQIVSLKVARDESSKSKGFAFVCYMEPQQATTAINCMHNQLLPPGKKRLNVLMWKPKEARFADKKSSEELLSTEFDFSILHSILPREPKCSASLFDVDLLKNFSARSSAFPSPFPHSHGSYQEPRYNLPHSELREDEEKIVIYCEMPGVKNEEVRVRIEKGRIFVDVESREEINRSGFFSNPFNSPGRRFSRYFDLPPNASASDMSCAFSDGVLRIVVNKILPNLFRF